MGNRQLAIGNDAAAFTIMEIAICLAIIGFALVAIIGVLPYGMNTQRDNREETIINQDASVLVEAIRNGAYGYDGLTNNVIAITNNWQEFNNQGQPIGGGGTAGFTYNAAYNNQFLTNGARIIGLLSTPQFTDVNGDAISDLYAGNYYSNHITAYIRAISGVASEKPPQDNAIMQENGFTYRVYIVNAPMPQDANAPFQGFARQLAANQRELRLTFTWPVLPNGKIGSGRYTYRTVVGGQLIKTNFPTYTIPLYFYQPQSFKAQ